jgi:hypothetical protein
MPNMRQADVDDLIRLRSFEAAYVSWRDHIIRLLASEKFTGTEQMACYTHRHHGGYDESCHDCTEVRKDWIAVADILNLLRCLEDQRG